MGIQLEMTMRTEIPIYQVDAFSNALFAGNPAAVCPLSKWPNDAVMQLIAAENNLSETAFFAPEGDGYRLRWFTPKVEVPLCGHATLASGYVVLNILRPEMDSVIFETHSGPLEVWRDAAAGRLAMSLPATPSNQSISMEAVSDALGKSPMEIYNGQYPMAVYNSPEDVLSLRPDMAKLNNIGGGVIVTAAGEVGAKYDVISRFFAPAKGVPEDPVTGSAHCQIIPYWAKRFGRAEITAYQASARGGWLYCTDARERVILRGDCALYMQGKIFL